MGINFSSTRPQTPATDQRTATPKQEARHSFGLTGRHPLPKFHTSMHKAMSFCPDSPKLNQALTPASPPEPRVE